jgi:DNA-binding winged helix-turn-helix (wHTH) protein
LKYAYSKIENFKLYKIKKSLIEIKSNQLFIDGIYVSNQKKILRAISIFMKSGNVVVSKENLIKQLWGDLIVSDDSLFKIIQELRKIFKSNGLDNILVNVYGQGYEIKPKITLVEKTELKFLTISKVTALKLISFCALLICVVYVLYSKSMFITDKITPQNYIELVNKAHSNPKSILTLLMRDFNDNLNQSDQAKTSYIKGIAYYKMGDFDQSLLNFDKTISLAKNQTLIKLRADAYLAHANINVYRQELPLMWEYLNLADKIYLDLKDETGISDVMLSKGRYYIAMDDFPQSIKKLKQLISRAELQEDLYNQVRALRNLAYVYEIQGAQKNSQQTLGTFLKLALKLGDASYISKAYEASSKISMTKGHFIKAMEHAQLTIRYAIENNDSNNFQQSFSSLYNILNSFGHSELAEKYLTKAIDYQYIRNNKGNLIAAELNLGILNLQQHKYQQSQQKFSQILNYNLSESEQYKTKAWLALTQYFKKDFITAYSLSKEIYILDSVSNDTKIIAGIAMALSGQELELFSESSLVLSEVELINKDKLLIENAFFLNLSSKFIFDGGSEKQQYYIHENLSFQERLKKIRQETLPNQSFINSLDAYLNKNFIP